jgi:hypothetical protein
MSRLRFSLATIALMLMRLLAHLFRRESEAQSLYNYMIRWMGSPGANYSYCFGSSGWHGQYSGTAADIFADSSSPCNDPDNSPNGTYAMTYGAAASATSLLGARYDAQTSQCYISNMDVHQYNPVLGQWKYSGQERYIHVEYSGGSEVFYSIPLGGGWSWQFAQVFLGDTRYPDKDPDCPTTAYHAHQETCRHPAGTGSVINTTLATNSVYGQFDLNRYIHKWDWNSIRTTDAPSICVP